MVLMKNAIILHGTPSREEYYNSNSDAESNKHWIPWLQRQLLVQDILTQTPELPRPFSPDYDAWRKVFESLDPDDQTYLVGHSCGAGFLSRWLTETGSKVKKLVLVAPWVNTEKSDVTKMFDFKIDPKIIDNVGSIDVLVSDDDDKVILDTVEVLKNAFPKANIHTFKGMGHFTLGSMGRREFPELLSVVLAK